LIGVETTSDPLPRETLLAQFARIGHAISSPPRLRIIGLLAQGEKTVERLAEQNGQSIAATSAHLQVLRGACLVINRREGRHVHYRLSSDSVIRFWLGLQELGREHLPEVREVIRAFFEENGTLIRLSDQELREELREGRVVLIDVRPVDEYDAGHLPQARSVPFERLEAMIAQLPPGQKIIAYCRGPYCLTAVEAVNRLRAAGRDAYRLAAGVAEWKAAGWRLETQDNGPLTESRSE
jgi:rhodanese-related sulfurtransferase